jgi:hypothetical protein
MDRLCALSHTYQLADTASEFHQGQNIPCWWQVGIQDLQRQVASDVEPLDVANLRDKGHIRLGMTAKQARLVPFVSPVPIAQIERSVHTRTHTPSLQQTHTYTDRLQRGARRQLGSAHLGNRQNPLGYIVNAQSCEAQLHLRTNSDGKLLNWSAPQPSWRPGHVRAGQDRRLPCAWCGTHPERIAIAQGAQRRAPVLGSPAPDPSHQTRTREGAIVKPKAEPLSRASPQWQA